MALNIKNPEVERLAAAQRELSINLPPIEALRAWMMLFVDYIATKQIIAPALKSVVGGPLALVQTGDEYPLLKLNRASWAVLRGEHPVRLVRLARREKSGAAAQPAESERRDDLRGDRRRCGSASPADGGRCGSQSLPRRSQPWLVRSRVPSPARRLLR